MALEPIPSGTQFERADFIIIGSGIAGLRAALELSSFGSVWILTKGEITDSATHFAQGGIAAALAEDDTVELHLSDTLAAGDGLCDAAAVRILVEEGPALIGELLEWGAAFDRINQELQYTREGAHSRSRILHAHGDSTGREIAHTLARRTRQEKNIQIRPHAQVTALLTRAQDGQRAVCGVQYLDLSGAEQTLRYVCSSSVLLATGGLGQLFSDSTNPEVATGAGPALAFNAGALLADMEFVQFHPTALALAGAPRFLISEALRGEGALLLNPEKKRFMPEYHAAAELAPRDVVARAIDQEIRSAQRLQPDAFVTCFLDATALPASYLQKRFPRIVSTLREVGLDLTKTPIPIRPAAHYAMGGVWTDADGRSSVPNLFAAGETACTGVHGANRLASNSLLEGLVFGARAGRAMAAQKQSSTPVNGTHLGTGLMYGSQMDFEALRQRMWRQAGIRRNAADLSDLLSNLSASLPVADVEQAHARTTARAILISALRREESRGSHFREDFPRHVPALEGHHTFLLEGVPAWLAPFHRPLDCRP